MEPTDLLRYVITALDRLSIDYAVVGSIASSYYGEPRLTNDIDVVANLRPEHLQEFLREFPMDEFYVSEAAAWQAIQTHGQFNIIHPESGLKADIIIPHTSAFDQIRLWQARKADFEAYFASPEDVILKKMEFYREGGSDKHLRDIAGMLKIRGEEIDRNYITDWAQKLGVTDIWTLIRSRLNLGQ